MPSLSSRPLPVLEAPSNARPASGAPDASAPRIEGTASLDPVLKHARPGPRYTSYPPVPAWSADFGEAGYRSALADLAHRREDPVSIYVHLPFCAERCAYCGCNATVTRHEEVVDRYLDHLGAEIGLVRDELAGRRNVVQLHWGGGTPNFLTPQQTVRLHRIFSEAFHFDPRGEWGVEVDPRIAEPARMHLYRELGFDRVSLGVQDLDPRVQLAIGRIQPVERTAALFAEARRAGFLSVNIDLVYGLPFQTVATLSRTLDRILEWGPDRIAVFGYAHLPHILRNQKQVDARELPDAAQRLALFRLAVKRLEAAGYEWVGLDHFARPDDELARAARDGTLRRNFMGYVTDPAPHLLGFGSSAIGEVAGRYVQNEPHLGRYQRAVADGHLPIVRGHTLTGDDLLRREAIHGLLCTLRLKERALPPEWQSAPDPWLPFRPFEADGLVEILGGELRVSTEGRYLLRSLCMTLDASLPPLAGRSFSQAV